MLEWPHEGMDELVVEKLEVTKEVAEQMKQNYRRPGETLTAWADRLRNNPSPQATDAE